MAVERVLLVGATGNIGVSAAIACLRTKREVLAIVRNQDSADKFFKHVGTKEGITVVKADVTTEDGVQGVVDKVKAGALPSFQHVYACVGVWIGTPLHKLSTEDFRRLMRLGFDANYFAYRATVPYLLEQNHPNSTWTCCTGAADISGYAGLTGATQGALVAMLAAAVLENERTNIRVNEAYLMVRVEVDSDAEAHGVMTASEYAKVYAKILEKKDIDGCKVIVRGPEDLKELRFEKKLPQQAIKHHQN